MTVTESFVVRMKIMGFNRVERIQEEYKRELSSIIRTIKDPRLSSMVSVVAANVTKDLKYAKVYISVLGNEEEKKSSMEALKSSTGYIKREIGSRLNLRCVPHPTFVLDNSIDYGMHINELLHKINKNDGE